jgi:hypothetical protein
MKTMLTRSGKWFDPFYPSIENIDITDIGHALSNICRFAGHTSEFYSVAQHSVYVAQTLRMRGGTPIERLAALLHDAPEAYLIDLPTPIKIELPAYKEAEGRWWSLIKKYWELPDSKTLENLIHSADMDVFATEARDLMSDPKEWKSRTDCTAQNFVITPMPPIEARQMFFAHYDEIIGAIRK